MNTSIEEAHGAAVGFSGHIHGFNADVEMRLDKMMMSIGKWIEEEAGLFLGHVKLAITHDGKGINLNLTDLNEGVQHHNSLLPKEKVEFSFMAAVTDVDEHELEHMMMHTMEDSGVDFCLVEHECACGHHHGHDHEHHDRDHHHEHHHEHGEECRCGHHHDHEHHDDECGCGHHYHHDDEHQHHHHDGECKCGHHHDHE